MTMRLQSILVLAVIVWMPLQSVAASKAKQPHVHGAASLNIAIMASSIAIQFEAPADSIIGFEYIAKSEADKKNQSAALDILKTRIGDLVIFDAKAGCKISPLNVAVEKDPDGDDHLDVNAEFEGNCSGSLKGTSVSFGFSRVFPRIADVDIQLINGEQQTGAKIHNDKGSISLQ